MKVPSNKNVDQGLNWNYTAYKLLLLAFNVDVKVDAFVDLYFLFSDMMQYPNAYATSYER